MVSHFLSFTSLYSLNQNEDHFFPYRALNKEKYDFLDVVSKFTAQLRLFLCKIIEQVKEMSKDARFHKMKYLSVNFRENRNSAVDFGQNLVFIKNPVNFRVFRYSSESVFQKSLCCIQGHSNKKKCSINFISPTIITLPQ